MLDMDVIYREYADSVFRFLMTLCREECTAEELTQETFYQAVRSAHKYDGTKKVHILDENAKEVMLLRITGEFSFKEIGEIFGKNENWARVTFYRAKQKIVKGR